MSDLSAIHKNVSDNNIITNSESNLNHSVKEHEGNIQGTFDANNPNIYFQPTNSKPVPNLLNWTEKFSKVPTFEEIEEHIRKIIENGIAFDTLSPKWKIDIKGGDRVVEKIANDGNFQKLNNSESKRHNKYVNAIEELITNSVYKNPASKNKQKPNVRQYHYFISHVQIGEKIYEILLECEELKKDKKPPKNESQTVHLYNLKEIKRLSKGQYAKRIQSQFLIPAPSRKSENNINQTNNNFNPKKECRVDFSLPCISQV